MNSLYLVQNMPNAKLILYPDANHGSWYENHEDFVFETNRFLNASDVIVPVVTNAAAVLVSALFLLSLWIMKRIVESPLGRILQAIRENEVRAQAVGYDVARFKLAAFVIGGAFSGAAGVLYAMLFGIVPLEAIGFVTSGNVVFATLIGGSGSLYGPIIGSFVFIWLSESVSTLWARWPLLLGVAFVIVVLFFRGGVVEAWSRLWRSSKPRT